MLYLSIGKALIACVVEYMNVILVGFLENANGENPWKICMNSG